MPPAITVSAPSRLHFGLFSFGHDGTSRRRFGGVGVMIDRPRTEIRIEPSARFEVSGGEFIERIRHVVERWCEFHRQSDLPRCRIEVVAAPCPHVGLGTGTQLALSVATGLNAWSGLPGLSPLELARCTGRAQRSAVGTYGFLGGGLIVERGRFAQEPISPLDCRITLPAEWRFVLARPSCEAGLSGQVELQAFRKLPPVAASISNRLVALARASLVPAAVQGDYTALSEALYEYGCGAGLCFSELQGGAFNGPEVTSLVERIRSLGVRGVGQSSWGPTVYALLNNEERAEWLRNELSRGGSARVSITAPDNRGVIVRQQAGEASV